MTDDVANYPRHNVSSLVCRCGKLKCTSARYRATEKPTPICDVCDRPGKATLASLGFA